jgi:hypothetical protein
MGNCQGFLLSGRLMQTRTMIVHSCTTTTGEKVQSTFAIGQVWLHRGEAHVVQRVFAKKVRFEVSGIYMTVGQEPFVKHAKLVLDPR